MRKPFVAGNWKMHGSKSSVTQLLSALIAGCGEFNNVELAIFPPYIYIDRAEKLLSQSPIAWGAQDVCNQANGAFTGEVSGEMLQEFGCTYVIVGHSERRHLFLEDNKRVSAKFHAALKTGLRPILCVGESLAEREQGQTLQIIQEQLAAALGLQDNAPSFKDAVIAYEPVWAIGTGKIATPEQAQEVHAFIRQQLTEIDADMASKVRIIYGGSVKPDNAAGLFSMPDIDGALVGGASLNTEQFFEIVRQCNK